MSVDVDFIELTEVQYLSGYKLQFLFNDGKKQMIDFESFLNKSKHPSIQQYLDLNKFQHFTFAYGHLHWNDYELSFSNDDLYEGKI